MAALFAWACNRDIEWTYLRNPEDPNLIQPSAPDQTFIVQADVPVADAFLAAALRGENPSPPALDGDLVVQRALFHGVSALLVAQPAVFNSLPAKAQTALQGQALAETMWDLRHRQLLVPLLQDLDATGVVAVLLKGTALAYGLYTSPAHRPRGDTDLLVAPRQLQAARDVLARQGFVRASEHAADRMAQEEWVLPSGDGTAHAIDLHWNLLRPWALATLFDTETLLQGTVALPRLCPTARRLSSDMALLHACAHRASHFSGAYFVGSDVQYGGNRLIWFVDMDLLISHMDQAEWLRFIDAAIETGMAALCLDALQECARLLHSPVPPPSCPELLQRLAAAPSDTRAESYFVKSSLLGRIWADMRALPKTESRLAFLRELILPSNKIMRAAYPELARYSMPRLHLHRFKERIKRLHKERMQRGKPS